MNGGSRFGDVIRVRAPRRLAQALEAEAERRMLSKSDVIRQALATHLGLLPDQPPRQGAGTE